MWPHKILTALLYGQFPWLSRDGGMIHGGLGPMAKQLGLRKHELVNYLEWLHSQGLLTTLSVHPTHFLAQVASPVGWAKAVGGNTL